MHNGENRFIRAIRSKFVTLPGEELILVQRKHPLVFIFPAVVALTFGIISAVASLFLLPFVSSYMPLLIAGILVVLMAISTIIIKSIVDWYFNFYVATNRKIIEISYRPLASRDIDEILLDQVKCTEIEAKTEGIVNELLDIGDVVITFDRPTHMEEFRFADIKDPKRVETRLENALLYTADNHALHQNGDGERNLFIKDRTDDNKWKYIERIIPRERRGGDIAWSS